MGFNFDALLRLAGSGLLQGANVTVKGRQIPVGNILTFYVQNKASFDAIFSNHKIVQPATDRPLVDGLPDDKIAIVPVIIAKPPVLVVPEKKPQVKDLGYTGLQLQVQKAQYNHELFPEQYTDDNQFGLYRPARQSVYNRRSKIWFDMSPFKGNHKVEADEGTADGLAFSPVWYLEYNGQVTIVRADKQTLHDTPNGSGRPIQVVEGESVGVGFTPWDWAQGFLCQINVGDSEGKYRIYGEIPELGLRTEYLEFTVS